MFCVKLEMCSKARTIHGGVGRFCRRVDAVELVGRCWVVTALGERGEKKTSQARE